MKNLLAIFCLLFCSAMAESCSELQKFNLMEKVENCHYITINEEFESVCERLEHLTNNCTKPLEECYDEEDMDKIKANYLENVIFDTWASLLIVEQLSTTDKIKLRAIWGEENTISQFAYGKQKFDYEKTKPRGFTLSKCKNATNIKVEDKTECKLTKVWTKKVSLKRLNKTIFGKCPLTKNYLKGGRRGTYGPSLTCHGTEYSDYRKCWEREHGNLKKLQTTSYSNLFGDNWSNPSDENTFQVPTTIACQILYRMGNDCLKPLKSCTDWRTMESLKMELLENIKKMFVRPNEVINDCSVFGKGGQKGNPMNSYGKSYKSSLTPSSTSGKTTSYTTTYTIIPVGLIFSILVCMLKICAGACSKDGGSGRTQEVRTQQEEAQDTYNNKNELLAVYNNLHPPTYEEYIRDKREISPPIYDVAVTEIRE